MTTEPTPTPADATLCDRIAKVLREHGMVHLGDQVPADEYDCCADAALAVIQPELDRLAADQERYEEETVGRFNEQATKLARRAGTAEATITRVRELHRQSSYPDPNGPGEITYCVGCEEGDGAHPCPTITALAPPADQPDR